VSLPVQREDVLCLQQPLFHLFKSPVLSPCPCVHCK